MDDPAHEPSSDDLGSDDLETQITALPGPRAAADPIPSADASPSLAAGRSSLRPHLAPRQRAVRLGAALGAILLALVVILGSLPATRERLAEVLHTRPAPSPPTTMPLAPGPLPLGIVPRADGLHYPSDISWTPIGYQVAVLGQLGGVAGPGVGSGAALVNIYSATSGHLVSQFAPTAELVRVVLASPALATLASPALVRDQATTRVNYTHILWSPDGGRLALTFTIIDDQHLLTILAGILISDSDGGHADVLLRRESAPPATLPVPPIVWDLMRGTSVSLTALPPALGYHWGPSGTLLPETLLSATSAPPAPPLGTVGNPNGDAAFTLWQPGWASIRLASPTAGGPIEPPGAYGWASEFAAWSPDGRYLLDSVGLTTLGLSGRLQLAGRPAPSPQVLADYGLLGVPLLPVRDVALNQLLAAMSTGKYVDDGSQNLRIAWRPDGRMLAVQRFVFASDHTVAQSAISLYDCATGQKRTTLVPVTRVGPLADSRQLGALEKSESLLRWSPDGRYLLLYDPNLSSMTIWGPGLLPA